MKIKWTSIITFLIFCTFSILRAQEIIQRVDTFSYIDWSKMVVRATGVGSFSNSGSVNAQKVEALENAKTAAQKNLLKAVESIVLNGHETIKETLQRNRQIRATLKNLVSHYVIVDTRSMSDMSIEVEIELPITGALSDIFYPKRVGHGVLKLDSPALCPTCWQPWPERRPVPENITLIKPENGFRAPNNRPFTSVIIDARGLGIAPALIARIVNENGEEFYGPGFIDRKKAVENGMVVYKKSLKDAFNDVRAGKEPLFIKAIKAAGKLNTDVMIANNEAVLIHAAAKIKNFLKTCKVILVI